jgi:hypothetical protein
MASTHELARGHQGLRTLIEFVLREGWQVTRTPSGVLELTKDGCASIYTASYADSAQAQRHGGGFHAGLKADAPLGHAQQPAQMNTHTRTSPSQEASDG